MPLSPSGTVADEVFDLDMSSDDDDVVMVESPSRGAGQVTRLPDKQIDLLVHYTPLPQRLKPARGQGCAQ